MINYSIIIPHKDAPDLLEYCLSTIPVRDDVQVIVVDDNSNADKVDFEHFPKWKGEHYEYYLTKEGKGAGYARNVGLHHAKGKWVLFVDADDYLLPNISAIFDESLNSVADVIYFKPTAVMLKDRKTPSLRASLYESLIDNYFQTGDDTHIRVGFYSPCSKLIKLSFIKESHMAFEEIRYSNDNLFSAQVGCSSKKILIKDECYYVITQGEHSLTSNFGTKQNERAIRAGAMLRTSQFVKQQGYEIDFRAVSFVIAPLLFNDRGLYRHYFKEYMHVGYSKIYLTKKIFNSPNWKARTWRRIYSYLVTICL